MHGGLDSFVMLSKGSGSRRPSLEDEVGEAHVGSRTRAMRATRAQTPRGPSLEIWRLQRGLPQRFASHNDGDEIFVRKVVRAVEERRKWRLMSCC